MAVLHGLKESDTRIASFLFVVTCFENEAIQELATLDFFHHQEVVIRSLKRFVQTYNVRVIKLLHNGDFNMQRCPFFFALIGLGGNLDSVRGLRFSVCRGLDDGKGPLAELCGKTTCLV
jgi:hypothetical protein